MLGSFDLMAFVVTTDVARARQFYQDILGLRVVSEDPNAFVLDAKGTLIRVSKVRDFEPVSHTMLGWLVPDARAAVLQLGAAGVEFERFEEFTQDTLRICTFPDGTKVAWFKDPDGNTLSITQPAPPAEGQPH
ncbi:MAG: VOC family protein [Candidatus Latescibacteria bacterium]|nr:VOC family protein [Candidatus Latescibacterota bacterium]